MLILILIWLHLIADFVFQSNWMALNKSKNIKALAIHSIIYGTMFIPFGLWFSVISGVSHYFIDLFSSQLTTNFYEKKQRYGFFVTIGIDQTIHITILILLLSWLR